MIVAIPKFNDQIAPCFEVANTFLIAEINDDFVISKNLHNCEGCEGFGRLRFLNEKKVKVLICNGIKGFYKDILINSNITVIDKITLPIDKALADYCNDKLKPQENQPEIYNIDMAIPLDDIICWAKDLFESNGYEIMQGEDIAPFPIDLVAEMKCPVCGKPVRVAICCGAHSYRVDRELSEFHRVSSANFNGKVYIHPAKPEITKLCAEYEIELIDPFTEICEVQSLKSNAIPLFKRPVSGHEKAWSGN